MPLRCKLCAEDDVAAGHDNSRKHLQNEILHQLSKLKHDFQKQSNGVTVTCTVACTVGEMEEDDEPELQDSELTLLKVSIKPGVELMFSFSVTNNNQHDMLLRGVMMFHSDALHFDLAEGSSGFDVSTHLLAPSQKRSVDVHFRTDLVGVYLSPMYFLFRHKDTDKASIIEKKMMVFVETVKKTHSVENNPYTGESVTANQVVPSVGNRVFKDYFEMPSKSLREAFKMELKVEALEGKLCNVAKQARCLIEKGCTQKNYKQYFHHLLWYEESALAQNLTCYNMTGVKLRLGYKGRNFSLRVPGLPLKRPGLMMGDHVFVKPSGQSKILFEAIIVEILEDRVMLGRLDTKFRNLYFGNEELFDIRFLLSRMPLEKMHVAVDSVDADALKRIFPRRNRNIPEPVHVASCFNEKVAANEEQWEVVNKIVSGSSGAAPYLLFGPPGTGKTVTIVEAILQLALDPDNHILVCTDSNAAADHIALQLIKHEYEFRASPFLLRANSRYRNWDTFPEKLEPYSKLPTGKGVKVRLDKFLEYRIVVITLIHAAKFASDLKQYEGCGYTRMATHLFIDEAAQASEPATLVPLCGLLAPAGRLVLAGDPMQLGPVCISRDAKDRGLGMSLMERLKNECPLYKTMDGDYIKMLTKNFRADEDLLSIPSELFYNNQLEAHAPLDALSQVDILKGGTGSRSIVFHGVLSQEQSIGKSPSYFNSTEIEMIQIYVRALIEHHDVAPEDIGVITPYVRQAHKIKEWLWEEGLTGVQAGTVESFQGREKRVVLVSTVRARVNLHDQNSFKLGFVKDAKRFNVLMSRARAKLIIVGNPLCLNTDAKWQLYLERCREFGTYTGFDAVMAPEPPADTTEPDLVTPLLREMTDALEKIKL